MKYKYIAGLKFLLVSRHKRKSDAQKRAANYKKRHPYGLVRVIKGKKYWEFWRRKQAGD